MRSILFWREGSSYTDIKSLEPKESTSQLNLTCSSDEVSTTSDDKLSSQSTSARSLKQIIADSLSNRSEFGRSTAQADLLKSVDRSSIKPIVAQSAVAKLSRLEAERLTCKSAIDTFFQNIDRANQINPLLEAV